MEVTAKLCGMKGRQEALVSRVWGTEVEASWASSTFPEDLRSARLSPGCKDPMVGNVEIGWGGLSVLATAHSPLFCPRTSIVPQGSRAHLVATLMKRTIKVFWPEGGHAAHTQTCHLGNLILR